MATEPWFVPYQALPGLEARRALVLAPHPDDEVFGCGATVAQLVKTGARVDVVIVADGSGDTAPIRRAESTQAAKVLGTSPPQFWGGEDGDLAAMPDLAARIAAALDETGADLLMAPSCWEMHPDHRAVASAALEAASEVASRGSLRQVALYEVGIPMLPNALVDITPLLPLKEAATACFPSQLALQRYDTHIKALNIFRSYTLGNNVEAAEAFFLLAPETADALRTAPSQVDVMVMRCEKALGDMHQARQQAEQTQQQLEQALRQSEQARASAEAENRALKQSRSWKLTAPLRWLNQHRH